MRNKTSGQWKAHGRYLARESATHRAAQRQAGFDAGQDKVDVASRLDDWQRAGDPRLWKIILSPELGDQLNVQQLARGVMARVEQEIGAEVEWIAVAHFNTGHPHVHVAMRGVDCEGREIRLPGEFVKHGIRTIAEQWCTEELGYRTRAQAQEALRREVGEMRYTSLDRIIARADPASAEESHFAITCQGGSGRVPFVTARLSVLEGMGLARRVDAENWEVQRDFQAILRRAQRIGDRQRTLAAGGVLRSDERLPIGPLDDQVADFVEGRILVHGEDDNGRSYVMLESTDAKVYVIHHTQQMQTMRNASKLRVNCFVRFRVSLANGRRRIEVEELGTAESILENRGYLRETVQRLLRKGTAPVEDGWSGWLGRYQRALSRAANDLATERSNLGIGR